MTRTDELFSMNGATLIQLADKLGVKVNCNKTRTQLKEKKENVVNRILEAEKKIADAKAEKQIEKAVKAEKKEKKAVEPKQKKEKKVASKATNERLVTKSVDKPITVDDKISEFETICNEYFTTKRSSKKGVLFVYNSDGRCIADIYFARKKVVLGVKVDLLPNDVTPDRIRQMGAAVDLEYSEFDTLISIIKRIVVPTRKTKKEEK